MKNKVKIKENKRGQEEMVGFALIIIIVAVIILVFIALTLTKPKADDVESYEVQSFLQALLQHTTDCEYNSEYLSIQKLIFRCNTRGRCLDERDTCEVLNETLGNIVENIWRIKGEGGYELIIISDNEVIFELSKGNITNEYKVATQLFSNMQISFKAYF